MTTATTPEKAAPVSTRAAFLFLSILTLLRLIYAANTGLAQDEAYYWQWSRHLDYSYYDQGPGIAYFIRFGTLLFGDTSLGVRFSTVLLGAGTGWFSYLTALRWMPPRAAWWSLLLCAAAPLFAVGSVIATYDGPQVFFWAAALYALTRTLQEKSVAAWYAVGVLVGLGSLCKLTMLLFAPGVLVLLLLSPNYRHWLRTPHPYLAFVLAMILFLPVPVWNQNNDWIGIKHSQTLASRHRGVAPLRWFGDFMGGQLLFAGPIAWFAELALLYHLTRASLQNKAEESAPIKSWGLTPDASRFLFSFFAPTMVICVYLSLKSKLEVNWPAPMHLTALMGLGAWFAYLWQNKRRVVPILSVAFSTLFILVVHFPDLVTAVGIRVQAKPAQKLNETYGWDQVMPVIDAAREQLAADGKPYFIAGINYRADSVLAYYLKGKPETQGLYLNSRRDQYYIWTDPTKLVGQNALLCLDDVNEDAVALARVYFDRVELVASPVATRPGIIGPVKTWFVYRCYNFKGYKPDDHADGY